MNIVVDPVAIWTGFNKKPMGRVFDPDLEAAEGARQNLKVEPAADVASNTRTISWLVDYPVMANDRSTWEEIKDAVVALLRLVLQFAPPVASGRPPDVDEIERGLDELGEIPKIFDDAGNSQTLTQGPFTVGYALEAGEQLDGQGDDAWGVTYQLRTYAAHSDESAPPENSSEFGLSSIGILPGVDERDRAVEKVVNADRMRYKREQLKVSLPLAARRLSHAVDYTLALKATSSAGLVGVYLFGLQLVIDVGKVGELDRSGLWFPRAVRRVSFFEPGEVPGVEGGEPVSRPLRPPALALAREAALRPDRFVVPDNAAARRLIVALLDGRIQHLPLYLAKLDDGRLKALADGTGVDRGAMVDAPRAALIAAITRKVLAG